MTELKPCPLCGQQPELKFWDEPIESSGTGYCFYIECACGLRYHGNYRFEYDSDCIEAWGCRAEPVVSKMEIAEDQFLGG